MAITPQQERELLNVLQDYIDTKRKANRFVNLADEQTQLMGQICIIISRKIRVSISDAQAYIDARTGKFRDAGYMPYCTDPKLIELFKRLETITKELNTMPWKLKADAVKAVADKQRKTQATIDAIKKQPGAQAVIDRVKAKVK